MSTHAANAPLNDIKVVEFAGLAPGPFAGLILADWGASVTRIDRVDQEISTDVLCRGKRSLAVDLKVKSGRDLVRKLISEADVVIDPFRPGVLERLGLGPEVFLATNGGLNSRLIYSRISGFDPSGPYRDMAGHDINYIALSGVLSMFPGQDDVPSFPLNLIADFAGGGLTCALGIILALHTRTSSGKGQIVNTDMVSGARYVSSYPLIHTLFPNLSSFGKGTSLTRKQGVLDGGAPFYAVYRCRDDKWISVGCIEPQFFTTFAKILMGALPQQFLDAYKPFTPTGAMQTDRGSWPKLKDFLTAAFKLKTRDEWADLFAGTDSCVVPVLSPAEAGLESSSPIPLPHPVLSATPAIAFQHQETSSLPQVIKPGQHTELILNELGFNAGQLKELKESGVLGKRTAPKL